MVTKSAMKLAKSLTNMVPLKDKFWKIWTDIYLYFCLKQVSLFYPKAQ